MFGWFSKPFRISKEQNWSLCFFWLWRLSLWIQWVDIIQFVVNSAVLFWLRSLDSLRKQIHVLGFSKKQLNDKQFLLENCWCLETLVIPRGIIYPYIYIHMLFQETWEADMRWHEKQGRIAKIVVSTLPISACTWIICAEGERGAFLEDGSRREWWICAYNHLLTYCILRFKLCT